MRPVLQVLLRVAEHRAAGHVEDVLDGDRIARPSMVRGANQSKVILHLTVALQGEHAKAVATQADEAVRDADARDETGLHRH